MHAAAICNINESRPISLVAFSNNRFLRFTDDILRGYLFISTWKLIIAYGVIYVGVLCNYSII